VAAVVIQPGYPAEDIAGQAADEDLARGADVKPVPGLSMEPMILPVARSIFMIRPASVS